MTSPTDIVRVALAALLTGIALPLMVAGAILASAVIPAVVAAIRAYRAGPGGDAVPADSPQTEASS